MHDRINLQENFLTNTCSQLKIGIPNNVDPINPRPYRSFENPQSFRSQTMWIA